MKNMKRKSGKAASFDAAEKAIEITCRWLYGRGMSLHETIGTDGSNLRMTIQSSDGKAGFCDENGDEADFPVWENYSGILKEDVVLGVVEWLFKKGGDGDGDRPFYTLSTATADVSPGRLRTTLKTTLVPKLEFSSLEEFVLKAEAAGL